MPKNNDEIGKNCRFHRLLSHFSTKILEKFDFLALNFAQQKVGQARSAESQPLVREPSFAEHFLHDGVVGERVGDGVDAASGLKADLNTGLFVVFLDGLAHHVRGFGRGRNFLFSRRGFDVVATGIHR